MMGKPDNCSFVKLYHRLHIDFSATPLWNRRGLRRGGSKSADAPRPKIRRLRQVLQCPRMHSEPAEKTNNSETAQLFRTFFKIGAFTFGGGYAMIELIKEETVHKHHWISEEDILDVVAIAESTPGPIAINSATFIGYKIAGVKGCLAATAGVVLPSFVIIYAISFILRQFENFAGVRYAFFGIRAAVLALILQALLSMYHACPKGKMEYILMAAAFAAVAIFDCSVLIVIVAAAVVGLACNHLIHKDTEEAGK